jgi:hypothetical protein
MIHALSKDMKWLEEIRVRTQPWREKEVLEILLETAANIPLNTLQEARVYSHYSTPAGFSLVLAWDTASIPKEGSETAVLILEGIKTLGLLDHTVLVERQNSGKIKKNR